MKLFRKREHFEKIISILSKSKEEYYYKIENILQLFSTNDFNFYTDYIYLCRRAGVPVKVIDEKNKIKTIDVISRSYFCKDPVKQTLKQKKKGLFFLTKRKENLENYCETNVHVNRQKGLIRNYENFTPKLKRT